LWSCWVNDFLFLVWATTLCDLLLILFFVTMGSFDVTVLH
jgi:hypothetical protein